MRNMAVLHSPAFSYPLPVLVRVLSNLLIFKGKILYYNKYSEILESMVNSQFKPVSGKIIFYRTDDNSVFRIIEFRCAYIVYYKEVFNVDKKRPLFTTITLSADSLIVGNAFLTNSW